MQDKSWTPLKIFIFNFRCSYLHARAKMGFGFGPNQGPNRSEKCSESEKHLRRKMILKQKGVMVKVW